MTLLDALEDLKGCTLVHVDRGRGLAVFWNGSKAFLEYRVDDRGNVTQGEAWTLPRQPTNAHVAAAEVAARYGL